MSQWDALFQSAGQKYNVDPRLIAALVQTESSGNPNAYNAEYGATGLGQQIPATAKALGIDPKDPAQSIEGVAKLLNENLTRYGSPEQAILAYHGGTDQANWGPKTQDYLRKVSANYGAPPVARASAIPDDEFEAAFGARPTAQAAPAPVAADEFEAAFGPRPTAPAPTAQAAQVVATTQAATAAPTAAAQPTGALATAADQIDRFGAQGIRNANAIGRGISDVFDAPSEWLAAGAEKSGLTGLLGRAGINMPTAAQQLEMNKASRAEYDARNADGGFQEGASRVGGNILGTAAPIAKAGQALTAGGNALLGAMRGTPALAQAVPAAQAAGKFVSGGGGLLSRMTNLGIQGGAGGALLSGASDTPLAEQMGVGAALGAALPPAYGVVSGLMRGGRSAAGIMTKPFSEAGRESIVNKVVGSEAAKAGGLPAAVMPYAAPGRAPTSFTPGSSGVPGIAPPVAAEAAPLATSVDDILGKASAGGKLAANFNEIIPGSRPTLSQATGNAGIATLERGMAARSTEAANAFNELQQANHAARLDFFNSLRGNPQTLEQAIAQREETAIPLLNKALEGRVPANATPVISEIDSILASPDGKRKAVRTALAQVKENIQDASGALETDAAQLYGVRKAINDQLEKVAGKDNSEAQQASAQLLQVKAKLDDVIEKAAPNFKEYLKQYADLSKPVTSQGYLQNLDLTEQTSSQLTLNKVKSAINKIERMRKASGANEGKDISSEQMDGLYRLQADLQREANSGLGRVKGSSDTTQLLRQNNLIDVMLGGVGGKAASAAPTAIGSGLGFMMGGAPGAALGGLIGQNVGSAAGKAISSQAPAVEANLLQLLTRPQGPEVLRGLTPKATDSLLERAMNKGASGVFGRGN